MGLGGCFFLALCGCLQLAAAAAPHTYPYIPGGTFLNKENKRLMDVAAEAGPAGGEEAVPVCRSGTEACGFYTFNPATKRPLKWVDSWCVCAEDEECVFGGRSRQAYKHVCLPLAEEGTVRNGHKLIRLL